MSKKKKVEEITVKIKLLGKFYEAKGKTVDEVINKLAPPVAKGMGILILEKGKMRKEKVLNARVVNNVWGQANPMLRKIAMKSIISLFNDFDK